jgi:hypothetical protein
MLLLRAELRVAKIIDNHVTNFFAFARKPVPSLEEPSRRHLLDPEVDVF